MSQLLWTRSRNSWSVPQQSGPLDLCGTVAVSCTNSVRSVSPGRKRLVWNSSHHSDLANHWNCRKVLLPMNSLMGEFYRTVKEPATSWWTCRTNLTFTSAGVQILVMHRGSLQEQMAEYQCACCKVPCAACESNFELEDLNETWSNEPCGPAPGGLSHSQIF